MSQYGDIIAGSISRAKIKGTDIENGTRYVKVINCVPVLPLSVEIGRFTLRMFADNNRTPCKHCGITSHPYFKCPNNDRSKNKNFAGTAKVQIMYEKIVQITTYVHCVKI